MKMSLGRLLGRGKSDKTGAESDLGTAEGRLSAIFNEIEATTQLRRLSVNIGGAELSLDAANRQVLKVVSMTPDPKGLGRRAQAIKRDYDDLDTQLWILAELLTDFSEVEGAFDLVSRQSTATYSGKIDGFRVPELRYACHAYVTSRPAPDAAAPPAEAPPEAEVEAEVEQDDAPEAEAEAEEEVAFESDVPEEDAAPEEPEPAPVAAAAPPEPEPEPAPPAPPAPDEKDTVDSVIAALGARADVAAAAAPAPDPAAVEKFYDALSKHCEIVMLFNDQGNVLRFSDEALGWFDLAPEISRDLSAWVRETARAIPGRQMILLRSPVLQNQSVVLMTDGTMTAFGVITSQVTGRVFAIANEYIRKRD